MTARPEMTIMWGFHILQRPIRSPATTARTLTINIPLTLKDNIDPGLVLSWKYLLSSHSALLWLHSALTMINQILIFVQFLIIHPGSPPPQVPYESHQEGGQHASDGEDGNGQRPVHHHLIVFSRLKNLRAVSWQPGDLLCQNAQGDCIMSFNDLQHEAKSFRGSTEAAM